MLGKYTVGLNVGLAGLALSNMSQITQSLAGISRNVAETEQALQSFERITEVSDLTPEEPKDKVCCELPQEWPQSGSIQFNNVTVRYRPGLPLVLQDFTAHIKPREKIGVVGRTGCGKSTLINVLFRILEVEEGDVQIDGINIHDVTLPVLRKKLSIIPQDPTLFNGLFHSLFSFIIDLISFV